MNNLGPVLILTFQLAMSPVMAGPFLDAARENNPTKVTRLLTAGVDVDERGQQDETALHWLAYHGQEALVRELIAAGARIDAQVTNGNTPLHLAAYNGHTGVAELLIAQGANVNAHTQSGFTPLDWARRNKHKETADLLIAHGAKDRETRSAEPPKTEPRTTELKDLKDLKVFTPLDDITAQAAADSASSPGVSTGETVARIHHPQTDAFLIQLGAFSTEARAVAAWERFRGQHPDILGHRELILNPVDVNGKRYHRVRSGPFERGEAGSLCNRLQRRRQPCLVIDSETP